MYIFSLFFCFDFDDLLFFLHCCGSGVGIGYEFVLLDKKERIST